MLQNDEVEDSDASSFSLKFEFASSGGKNQSSRTELPLAIE